MAHGGEAGTARVAGTAGETRWHDRRGIQTDTHTDR